MLRSLLSPITLVLAATFLSACAGETDLQDAPPTATSGEVSEIKPSPAETDDTISPMRVVMYKSPQCGCCVGWAAHLDSTGRLAVSSRDVANLSGVKEHLGIPPSLGSCHTAQVGDYVVEGHVPAREVIRVIEEQPEGVVALTVPGMPIGSPGMEVPGQQADAYDVIAIKSDGSTEVFASY